MPNTPPFVSHFQDPLFYLLGGLVRGVVPPEWRQLWTGNPLPDPLRSAWLASVDPRSMLRILVRVADKDRRSYLLQASKVALNTLIPLTTPGLTPSDDAMVRVLRAGIPAAMVPLIGQLAFGADP
jgi:hypothetical protein